MTTLQQQARALGDPTRHRIFEHIVEAQRPVGIAELTEHVGLHHNAVRQHLAKLVDADLLVASTAPSTGRGRPRLQYEVHPSVESRWGATGPYERLSRLLTEIIRTGDSPVAVGRRAGQRLRERIGPRPTESAVEVAMAREGFEPELESRGDRVDLVLQHCPFETAALDDPATVCALHRGIAEGLVEGDDDVAVDELVAKDPRHAGCRLTLRVAAD